MKKSRILPFIIVPQGRMQERLYYGAPNIKELEDKLLKIINRGIGNTRVVTIVIRVYTWKNYIIVVHLYPSYIKESFSGRYGQKVVIGYMIRMKTMFFCFNHMIDEINYYFELIRRCCRTENHVDCYVPDELLQQSNNPLLKNKLINMMENINSLDDKCFVIGETKEKISNIYKMIRKKIYIHKTFCYIKKGEEYEFCLNRELSIKLKKMLNS